MNIKDENLATVCTALELLPSEESNIIRTKVDDVFYSDTPFAKLQELEQHPGTNLSVSAQAVLKDTLSALVSFFQGYHSISEANLEDALSYFQSAEAAFGNIGIGEWRERAAVLHLYAQSIYELRKYNFSRSQELFSEVSTRLSQNEKFRAQDQALIDSIRPEQLFVQGIVQAQRLNFDRADLLIEEASKKSEEFAQKYHEPGSPLHNLFLGLSHLYSCTYTYVKASNDFNRFEYKTLSEQPDLAEDAITASNFLRQAPQTQMVKNQIYLSDAYAELLQVIHALSSVMTVTLTTSGKPSISFYKEVRRKIQLARDMYKQVGQQALANVIFCNQLLDQVTNLENLLRFVSKEQVALESLQKFEKEALKSLSEPLKNLGQWSKLALVFAALSIVLIFVGAVSALFGNTQIGVLTSVSSLLSSLISGILYSQIRLSRKDVRESRKQIMQQLERRANQYFGSGK